MHRIALICSLLLLCLSAGCGQTGPLYLPSDDTAEDREPDSADK